MIRYSKQGFDLACTACGGAISDADGRFGAPPRDGRRWRGLSWSMPSIACPWATGYEAKHRDGRPRWLTSRPCSGHRYCGAAFHFTPCTSQRP